MKMFLTAMLIGAVFFTLALVADATETNGIPGSFYRTLINTNSGLYAMVDSRREVVTLYDKAGRMLWITNVMAGLQSAPIWGERKIHRLEVSHGELWVNVGRAYGTIEIKTGHLKYCGQN